MWWMGDVAHTGEERRVYTFQVGKPGAKRSLKRWRHRQENGIRMDFREIGWGGGAVRCIFLA
jgi:hypothetical protein